MYRKNFIGLEGFVWWMGVVESRQDPLLLGRVQVRIFGWHTDNKSLIPSEDLPWAQPLLPVNGGTSTGTPKEGDYVMGFFSDGESGQFPIIMGILPGIPDQIPNTSKGFSDQRTNELLTQSPRKPASVDFPADGSGAKVNEQLRAPIYPNIIGEPSTSRLYRYENISKTFVEQRRQTIDTDVPMANGDTWSEPYPAYGADAPYNKVTETESGHLFELDDTPGHERIQLAHRSGTFQEIYPSGTKVEKVVKSNYQIVMADDNIHIMGKCNITIDSDANIIVLGDTNLRVGNDLNATVSGKMNLSIAEAFNIKASSLNVDIAGQSTFLSGSMWNVDSPTVKINKGVGASSGILGAPGREVKNNASVTEENIPIPSDRVIKNGQIDSTIGTAIVQSRNETGTPDAASVASTADLKPNDNTACIPIAQLTPSDNCINTIKKFEGFSSKAYVDPGTKSEPITIGYGATAAALGRPVALGDTVTQEQATQDLKLMVTKFANSVRKQLTVPCISQGQFDALCSFAYNAGAGNLAKSSMMKLTNLQDKAGAADAFLAWNKAAGKVLPGLTKRREAEKALYLS